MKTPNERLLEGRLINVSNRLPIQIKKGVGGARATRSSGGLVSALESMWLSQPGRWIGWAGPVDAEQAQPLLAKASQDRSYELEGITLSGDEVAKFYAGFANEIIWPLFHDLPARCNFDPDYWETYQEVNRKFAAAAAAAITDPAQDLIWAHDYHLMLMAKYLRQSGSKARAVFFLHIPFPAPDLFEKLPWREALLSGLLQFDLLGFQTGRDRTNFLACVERLLPQAATSADRLQERVALDGRQTVLGTFPISIDFADFARRAAHPNIGQRSTKLRAELNNMVMVLGVDRMDYTKGIAERLRAFRLLLRRFPEMRRNIALVQVVVPSREEIANYKNLRRELELLVSQINGEYTEAGWVPIHYMHRSLNREELLSYYRAADIALVTPWRDGMNLVAKEFCAAQVDERGVLILSEFAGAAPEMRPHALLVNPNDATQLAEAIHEAALMPIEEKRRRIQALRQRVREYDVQRWLRSFLRAANSVPVDQHLDRAGAFEIAS